MVDPLSKTFDLLATTKNLVAVDVLTNALESPHPLIVDKAVAALLRRGTTRCQTELIRRLGSLSATARKLLDDQGPRLTGTLRQCLLHGDPELRANALTIVGSAECFDQVSTLLQILEQRSDPFQDAACQALQDLINRMYEHFHLGAGRSTGDRFLRNLPQVRQTVLAALEGACTRVDKLTHRAEVVECALALGDAENFAVRKILLQGPPVCRETAAGLLLTSKHPGVLRLLVDYMSQNYPHAKAIEAFEQRIDSEFICYVLRTLPKRLTENQQKNFKQLVRVVWLTDQLLPLEAIPPGLHESLVAFIQATGIPTDVKIEAHKWLLNNGSVQGRLAAGRVLETLAPEAVRGILFGSLDSQDEDVQAWATSQLRAQGVPEAFRLLIERLDSPLPAVREAAREELGSFNLETVLNIFEHLDRVMCLRVGGILRKIDPDCVQKLNAELGHAIRRRRIRAARAAQALGLAQEVQLGLLPMLSDMDTLVRRTAVEVLATVPTPEVVAGLAELLRDPSPRVRESAEQSLDELHRLGVQFNELVVAKPQKKHETAGS